MSLPYRNHSTNIIYHENYKLKTCSYKKFVKVSREVSEKSDFPWLLKQGNNEILWPIPSTFPGFPWFPGYLATLNTFRDLKAYYREKIKQQYLVKGVAATYYDIWSKSVRSHIIFTFTVDIFNWILWW